MPNENLENELIAELEKLLNVYKKRIRDNHGREHKHLEQKEIMTALSTGATIGGVIGTAIPIPVAGHVIGAVGGIGVSAAYIGAKAAYIQRENKKIDNAVKVLDFLGEEKESSIILEAAAKRVIKEREMILDDLKETPKNKLIARYLAASMMAGIKHNHHNAPDKTKAMAEGVKNHLSKKLPSISLQTRDNHSLSLKDIAKNNKPRPHKR